MAAEATLARLRRLLAAAKLLSSDQTALGKLARERLTLSTGLSRENVAACLEHCLETGASDADLQRLCQATAPAPSAHVLLSANVFVGALRALCLATAASESVFVRPSRREPEMVELLARALADSPATAKAPPIFRIVSSLNPEPGDSVYAYGSATTLLALESQYPPGVTLHAHGPGFGVAVLGTAPSELAANSGTYARQLAWDTVLFDQRGCLSPRVVLIAGSPELGQQLAEQLAEQLRVLGEKIPLGHLSRDERAARTRFAQTMEYSCQLFTAGEALVSFDPSGQILVLPPEGRILHVVCAADVSAFLPRWAPLITTLGVAADAELTAQLQALLPNARFSSLGHMQCPALDGPVDRRTQPKLL